MRLLVVESYPESEGGDFSESDPEDDGKEFVYVDDLRFYTVTFR